LKRVIGHNILNSGYCVHPDIVTPDAHPEQGPVWEWVFTNTPEVMEKMGANYKQDGAGILRNISAEDLAELDAIFEITGSHAMFDTIEKYSKIKADELNLQISKKGIDNEYFGAVYTNNDGSHSV